MFCTNCGKKIEDEMTFCPYCGSKLEKPITQHENKNGTEATESKPYRENIENDSQGLYQNNTGEENAQLNENASAKKPEKGSEAKTIIFALAAVIIILLVVVVYVVGGSKTSNHTNEESTNEATEEIQENTEQEDEANNSSDEADDTKEDAANTNEADSDSSAEENNASAPVKTYSGSAAFNDVTFDVSMNENSTEAMIAINNQTGTSYALGWVNGAQVVLTTSTGTYYATLAPNTRINSGSSQTLYAYFNEASGDIQSITINNVLQLENGLPRNVDLNGQSVTVVMQ